jgi:hypothetical protein
MAVVGRFGKLADSIKLERDEPFNEHFHEIEVPQGTHLVYELENPAGPTSMYLTGLWVTFPDKCFIILKRDGTEVWAGRIGATRPNEDPKFPEGPIKLPGGQKFELFIENYRDRTYHASGNLFGYIK